MDIKNMYSISLPVTTRRTKVLSLRKIQNRLNEIIWYMPMIVFARIWGKEFDMWLAEKHRYDME